MHFFHVKKFSFNKDGKVGVWVFLVVVVEFNNKPRYRIKKMSNFYHLDLIFSKTGLHILWKLKLYTGIFHPPISVHFAAPSLSPTLKC